jgi:hypothetical protein
MKGADFEKINGFPCFWGWGMEDNVLQKRCNHAKLVIDRSVFYKIGSPEILQLFDGISRIISKKDPWRMDKDNGVDGLTTIHKLKYTIDENSLNVNDNVFSVHNSNIYFINISTFLTYVRFEGDNYYNYDLREPKRKIVNPDKLKETKQTVVTTDNWTNIPFYPTTIERKEEYIKQLINSGKPIPQLLIKEIEELKKKELHNDAFNNFKQTHHTHNANNPPPPHIPQNTVYMNQQPTIMNKPQPVPNKYSPQYAQYIGQNPRAQASARIRLGGVF